MSEHVYPNRLIPAPTAEKAQVRHTVEPNGCWVSTYKPMSNGYTQVSWQMDRHAYSVTAHRASYVHTNGPIPDGMVVDHQCHNRACVNPSHLRLLPRAENARRHLNRPDFPLGQCPNGHPLSEQRFRQKGRTAGLGYCGACLKAKNDVTTAFNTALYQLELAYGLGGHETKRNYAFKMKERQARVDAVREKRISESAANE